MAASAYQLREIVYQGVNATVFRGHRRSDGIPVVIKYLNPARSGRSEIAQFRREYAIARRLAGPGVVEALDFEVGAAGPGIVMADHGATSVARARSERPLALADILAIGARVASALTRVHGGGVVHKNVSPANIIWNPVSGLVELIDFGISAELARESAPADADRLEGTLAYIAPEQTGRMNRSLDWRSDLYALGATLYDLLTGRPPFGGDDLLSVVHGHIARPPEPPELVNPSIPPAVSAIVLRLLVKEPEQRYQSARGVQADLEDCLAASGAGYGPVGFAPCRHDRSPRFQVPERLYGRDADVTRLLQGFDRVMAGGSELLLVSGPPGIGKSALVREIQKPLTGCRGWFAEGKFDQLKRTIPYSALIQALRRLAGLLLAEPDAVLARRRAVLAAAVGVNGAVVTELVPEFAMVLGDRPPLPPVSPAENELRFQLTFQNLFVALATPDRPLVLFLDDLQWADRPSLALLGKLVTDRDQHYLMVIGACRPDGLEDGHPLAALAGEIARAGGRIGTVSIEPLAPADVAAMVADTVQRTDEPAEKLAALCYRKTQGNPFFLTRFLMALHEDGLIVQDEADGSWTWDATTIAKRDSTDNVVDLMVAKLRRLAPATGEMLSRAACIGCVFDLAVLAAATGKPALRVAGDLWPALQEGLIQPLDHAYRTLGVGDPEAAATDVAPESGPESGPGADALPPVRFRFLHDRVQQAAYTLVAADRRAAVHLRLGRLLLAGEPAAARGDRLFDILNHLNRGAALIDDAQERQTLIGLNLDAARRARTRAAYEPALGYALAGIELVEAGEGRGDAPAGEATVLALYDEAVTAAGVTGNHEVMERHARTLLARTPSGLEQARVQAVRMGARLTLGEPDRALEIGLQALRAAGLDIPHRCGRLAALIERLRGLWLFRSRHAAPLVLPADDRPTPFSGVCELLTGHISALHTARPDLLLPLAVRLLEWSPRTGDAGTQSIARSFWGVAAAMAGDLAGAGRAFADTAPAVVEAPTVFGETPRGIYIKFYMHDQWMLPWSRQYERVRQLSRRCLDRGDLEYGCFAAANAAWCGWHAGMELGALEAELTEILRLLARFGNRYNEVHVGAVRQAVACLRQGGEWPARLDGAFFAQDTAFEAMRRAGLYTPLAFASLAKLQLAVLLGRAGEARAALGEIEAAMDTAACFKDGVILPGFVWYRALALTGGALSGGALTGWRGRVAARLALARAIRRFRGWTAAAPDLHGHRLLLLQAEAARLDGRDRRAAALYDRAIAAAAVAGAVHEEALAGERAAIFHQHRGVEIAARAYRAGACGAYRRWGAAAKVQELERRFPDLAPLPVVPASEAGGGATDALARGRFDLEAVMLAARVISGEIRREALLETLLRTVLHLAGAGRGVLLLIAPGGSLAAVAEADAATDRFRLLAAPDDGEPAAAPALPLSIVSYAARTGETVVLADAAADSRFADDPDMHDRRPRSVLCLPLLRQGALVGVLYLENKLATAAFIDQRLEAPRLLAAQIAISLENARLYDELNHFNRSLENLVVERTAALQAALDGERRVHEDLRAAQKQLVQAEKLASLGQMVAGVAHEINTPVGNVLTCATLLQERLEDFRLALKDGRLRRSDADRFIEIADEAADLIVSNSRRAARLVQSFKQVAVDGVGTERRRFALDDWLGELVVGLEPAWQRAGCRFEVDCPCGIVVDGWPDLLAQVLTNLVTNSLAHAFGPDRGGTLSMRVRAPDPATVEFVYADDGRGIPPENWGKVFDPFFTTRRGAGNIGLGLHIVFTLVTAHLGGSIALDPAAAAGTRWIIHFPRIMPAQPHVVQWPCEPVAGQSGHC